MKDKAILALLLGEEPHFIPKLPAPSQHWEWILGKEGTDFQYSGRAS